jgi:ribonuclease BN (tRNA processing enzyme)
MMDKFSLTVLGGGWAVPTKKTNPAGFLVEAGDKKILMDAGFGILRRMVDFGFDFQDIDKVFVSHFHADHCCDAFGLIFSRNCNDFRYHRPHKKVLLIGPKGTEKNFKMWRGIFWPEPNEFYPVDFKEGAGKMKLGSVKIQTFPVQHVPWFQSLGIIIEFNNKKLVYTGDIGSRHNLQDLAQKAQDADLLIIEASVAKPQPNHFTLQQVKELVEKASVKKALIVHVSPLIFKSVEKFCQKEPKFVLSRDGLKIKI